MQSAQGIYIGGVWHVARLRCVKLMLILALLEIKHCSVPGRSLGSNGSSFELLPGSFFVVIETHWVLDLCLLTHSVCV
jgi:hypothetical protein